MGNLGNIDIAFNLQNTKTTSPFVLDMSKECCLRKKHYIYLFPHLRPPPWGPLSTPSIVLERHYFGCRPRPGSRREAEGGGGALAADVVQGQVRQHETGTAEKRKHWS